MHPSQPDERPHGYAILAATVCTAITMSMHPSGSALLNDYAATVTRNIVAHGLALLSIPLSLIGALGISRRLRRGGSVASADLGFLTYAIAHVAVLVAATASGLMAPAVARRLTTPDPATEQIWRALFRYTGIINQSFATLYVVGLALAVGLWSVAIVRGAAFPRWVGAFGTVLSLALLAVLVLSRAHLDVHSFGLVVILQGGWMIAVALPMIRGRPMPS